ncbi:starvation-inducible transcriptional regulator [Pseudomonas phage PspYZU05]|uniref:Uncharacterized protein n=1 Tax=Pseudomonas phage PspYZU05 TaxID=1983556 RepID=A0A2U7N2K4_9CAUD|nr:starvation-inducible transcriptional regulator [Pseudomonas phage PspYZU05]ASD52120.1 hypothetical protein PspYZU05_168 [Pseudomonas phage PspYZU05]
MAITKFSEMNTSAVDNFITLLLNSLVFFKTKHLQSDKYSEHIALDTYFNSVIPLMDTFSEQWIGYSGKYTQASIDLSGAPGKVLDRIVTEADKIYELVPKSCQSTLDDISGLALKVKYLLTLK